MCEIRKLLKDAYPGYSISDEGVNFLNEFCRNYINFLQDSGKRNFRSMRKDLTSFPRQIFKHGTSNATKISCNFSKKNKLVLKNLTDYFTWLNAEETAYFTAFLEYLLWEVIEIAIKDADQKVIITEKNIYNGLLCDEELVSVLNVIGMELVKPKDKVQNKGVNTFFKFH